PISLLIVLLKPLSLSLSLSLSLALFTVSKFLTFALFHIAEMEDIQLCLSSKNRETDDGCSIALELSESDPFFDLKKKLLNEKGFGIKEVVHLKRSSCPDSIIDTLNRMLQIARITHLDEAELYFGEVKECLSLGAYSPRNEMEALNFILSLIDTSLSRKKHMQIVFLRDLRYAVVDRIHEFGGKNKVVTKLDEKYNCDKEKCLVEWGESNGVRTKLQIAYVEGAGRGAIAMENLEVGDTVLEIPVSVIISEELVYKSEMYHILEKIDGISSETMLLLWSMKEKHICNSKFKNYFNTLPEEFNTGLSFGVDAIMALDGTPLIEEIIQAKEHLHSQYDELFPALSSDHPDIFPPELYTWEQFLWACELWYSNSMKVKFADGKLRTCLIPVAGFLNHSLLPHIMLYGKVNAATNSLKFSLSRPCSKGEQCFLSYGNLSGSHLVTFYGFLPQGDNLYDVIPVDIDVAQTGCIEDSTSNWTTHMVRGTWLSNNHTIFYYGLPSPLLDYLRRAWSTDSCIDILQKAKLGIDTEVLENLGSIFNDMMDNLGDYVDSENTSWDVKLALKFKGLQRRIMSSVLASCLAGIKLLEIELSKCVIEV
ncbi:SET domain-containing protein, partial [Cephalotus follicularis]